MGADECVIEGHDLTTNALVIYRSHQDDIKGAEMDNAVLPGKDKWVYSISSLNRK